MEIDLASQSEAVFVHPLSLDYSNKEKKVSEVVPYNFAVTRVMSQSDSWHVSWYSGVDSVVPGTTVCG